MTPPISPLPKPPLFWAGADTDDELAGDEVADDGVDEEEACAGPDVDEAAAADAPLEEEDDPLLSGLLSPVSLLLPFASSAPTLEAAASEAGFLSASCDGEGFAPKAGFAAGDAVLLGEEAGEDEEDGEADGWDFAAAEPLDWAAAGLDAGLAGLGAEEGDAGLAAVLAVALASDEGLAEDAGRAEEDAGEVVCLAGFSVLAPVGGEASLRLAASGALASASLRGTSLALRSMVFAGLPGVLFVSVGLRSVMPFLFPAITGWSKHEPDAIGNEDIGPLKNIWPTCCKRLCDLARASLWLS